MQVLCDVYLVEFSYGEQQSMVVFICVVVCLLFEQGKLGEGDCVVIIYGDCVGYVGGINMFKLLLVGVDGIVESLCDL